MAGKKQGFWGRLFGRDKPQETEQHETETQEKGLPASEEAGKPPLPRPDGEPDAQPVPSVPLAPIPVPEPPAEPKAPSKKEPAKPQIAPEGRPKAEPAPEPSKPKDKPAPKKAPARKTPPAKTRGGKKDTGTKAKAAGPGGEKPAAGKRGTNKPDVEMPAGQTADADIAASQAKPVAKPQPRPRHKLETAPKVEPEKAKAAPQRMPPEPKPAEPEAPPPAEVAPPVETQRPSPSSPPVVDPASAPQAPGILARSVDIRSVDVDQPAPSKADLEAAPVEQAKAGVSERTPQAADTVTAAPPAPKKRGWLQRLKAGLTKSSSQLTDNITAIFTKRKLDDDTLEELEDVLIQADLGVETAMAITEAVAKGRYDKQVSDEEVRSILAEEVEKVLAPVAAPLKIDAARKPHIVLVVGVNGTGKTTTIGKLAARLGADGHRVMLAAGDTFRAAAIDQLKIWGERTGAPVIAGNEGADASGLAFDAVVAARRQDRDVLLIDTAGRLHNKTHLMAELEKIVRVIRKHDESAPHDVILVLDATTGQNALQQVETFRQICGVTGLVMTKLDGTARGGILVAIAARHGLPVHAVGVGEGVDDLQPFEAADFARAIAGMAVAEPVGEEA
jgi:fused signal recognition particle receptor